MFENLDEYYQYIEKDNSLLRNSNISKTLISLRDKTNDEILKAKYSYEMNLYDFNTYIGDIDNKLIEYGRHHKLTSVEEDLNYLKSRAEIVQNSKYKAIYNHLLWTSKFKHIEYAIKAIDGYLTFLQNVAFSCEDNLSNRNFVDCFQNLFSLSQSINHKNQETIDLLNRILKSNRINGYQECFLMKWVVENGKKNEASLLSMFHDYANKIIEDLIYPDYLKDYLELQILLSQKLSISPKSFHNMLGEYYIEKSKIREDSFVVHDFYLKALMNFQKASNKEKIEEVSLLVDKAKKNLNLKSVKVEYADEMLQQWFNTIDAKTTSLIENDNSDAIFRYIIHNSIFPKAEVLDEIVQPSMFEFINVINFDINGNISGKKKSGINSYQLHIQNFSHRHLWMIFLKGVKSGKISYETVIDYLTNNSWYGTKPPIANEDALIEEFNWIELLSPSLNNFFSQLEIDIKLKTDHQAYILAIDSLTLKFEGLLREFSRRIGAQAIEIKHNATEERIAFDKIFANQKFIDLVPKDDIALFKFLLNSEGMDIRNNVAHCFYKTNSYSVGTMLLLIAALLKLGNYKTTIITN